MDDFFLDAFSYFRTILCMCPECNNIVRLSDLHLRSYEKSPRTWLDSHELELSKLEEKKAEFAEKERTIKEQARTRGRKEVKELVKKSMSKEFSKLKFDPYDIRAILHPVDFAIFNGMNNDMVKDIILTSKKTTNPILSKMHRDVENAIKAKSYDWKVVRVSQGGKVKFE